MYKVNFKINAELSFTSLSFTIRFKTHVGITMAYLTNKQKRDYPLSCIMYEIHPSALVRRTVGIT